MIENAWKQINNEPNLSPGIKALIDALIAVIQLLAGKRLAKNSKNSNVPPSMDPNREKKPKPKRERKPGGQPGHAGVTLQQTENPDMIIEIKVDRESLPPGRWTYAGCEKRQIFDLKITAHVTEYRAEILVNERGDKATAEFPSGLVQKAQYGNGVKKLPEDDQHRVRRKYRRILTDAEKKIRYLRCRESKKEGRWRGIFLTG